MPWSQQGGRDESEVNLSVPQQEMQAVTTRSKALADYDLEVNYKSEGTDPEIKAVNEEENSDFTLMFIYDDDINKCCLLVIIYNVLIGDGIQN